MNKILEKIFSSIHTVRPELQELSSFIHSHPELGFEEFQASERQQALLKRWHFNVAAGLGNLPTSFKAEKMLGTGRGIHFGFMSEFDALPGIGHACGHNLICVSALAAAWSASEILQELGTDGKITVFGTPGEEMKGGKVKLLEAGVFEGVDASLISHPYDVTSMDDGSCAVARYRVIFHGRASHAGMAPELGINALDAMIAFYNGISMWRQQIPEGVRVHGIITHGGTAPNMIPDYTEAFFYIRCPGGLSGVAEGLEKRFASIAEGAAEGTGCRLELVRVSAYKACVVNGPLNEAYAECWTEMGEKIRRSDGTEGRASTDFGDVSHQMPGANLHFGICHQAGIPLHCETFRDVAGGEYAFSQAMKCAAAMSFLCIRYFTEEPFRNAVNEDFRRRTASL